MEFIKKHNLLICSSISLLLGALIFVCFFGYHVINPTYIDWLINNTIDMRQYYTGWHYFRNSTWTFPLGVFNSLSYPNQISILNTDSIPLLAIFFKIFRNIIPKDFQYLGLYSLICYMLQSLFAMLIIKKFTSNDFFGYMTSILASLFFVLMPCLITRTLLHSVFVFQWIILACFASVVYKFNLKTNNIYFTIIGFLTASINPYILIIVAIVTFFICLNNFFNQKKYKEFLPILLFTLSAFVTLQICGAFVGMSHLNHIQLTDCSFNLNGFINSYGDMRYFSNFKTYSFSQIEGFAYFGIGILILSLTTLIHLIIKFLKDDITLKFKKDFF